MLKQLLTIAWAQSRILRNHLPGTTLGSLVGISVALVWYGGFAVLAAFIATWLPSVPRPALREWLGPALFGVFLFWQVVPLVTLTGGWSLDLKRLQVYPLSADVLLAAEVVLRVTAAGEMLLVLIGGAIGLTLNPAIPQFAALALLLYIPFNLLVSLTIRDLLSTAFQTKSYLREIFAVALITVGVIPQLFVRIYLPHHNPRLLFTALDAAGTPWHAIAALATADHAIESGAVVIAWLAVTLVVARWQFARALKAEDQLSTPVSNRQSKVQSVLANVRTGIAAMFSDPVGALIEKELRSLVRMPRFRVVFLLASVLGVVVFLPMQLRFQKGAGDPFSQHSAQLMSVYGILILSDALLWNMFGFDRAAAQVYFVTPISFAAVIRAKNIVAALFIGLQTLACLGVALAFRVRLTPMMLLTNLAGASVTAILFVCIGNFSSTANPRAADPKATLRKQNTGVIQLWMLGCTLCVIVLLGAAYMAGWATDSDWATVAIEALELAIGVIAYRFSIESAVGRVSRKREQFLTALEKSSSPIAS